MTTWIIVLALLWPLFWLLRVFMVSRLLLGIEFRRDRVSPLAVDELPAHLREAALPAMQQLSGLGFRVVGGLHFEQTGNRAFDQDVVILVHSEQPIRAHIVPHPEAARSGECYIGLRSTTAAGHELITTAFLAEQLAPIPGALHVELVANATAHLLMARHLERIARAGEPFWPCPTLEAAAAREQNIRDAQYRVLTSSGLFAAHGDSLSYKVLAGIERATMVIRQAAAQKKAAKGQPPRPPSDSVSEDTRAAYDLIHYRQYLALTRGRMSLRTKTAITLVSFVVFAAVLAWQASPAIAISLLVALVIHEGGHLVGMWLFGFRDTQLLFLPFFGGAAVGHDDKILKPWQHIVIILLGPLPGIFAALGLITYQAVVGGGPEWLQSAAITALVMNAFNLLPILPLDGGQIVDYAVASRFPRARVAFLAISAVGLLLLGIGSGGIRFLAVAGVMMLLRTPLEWRLAQLRRGLRETFPDGADEETLVRAALVELRSPEFRKLNATQRLQQAHGLQNVLRTPAPGFGTMAMALAGFTAPVWLGLPVAVWSASAGSDRLLRQAEARAVAAGLTPAVAPAKPVAPEGNAAVLYAQAEALSKDGLRNNRGDTGEVVKLLREAARKPAFVPTEVREPKTNAFTLLFSRGWMLHTLAEASEQKLHYGEKEEALAIAVDGLRLIRLLDSAPGWWQWDAHERASIACWSAVEAALAAGAKVTKAQAVELRQLADERSEISFAAAAIPQGMLAEARASETVLEGRLWRLLLAFQYLSPELARMRAKTVDDAVTVRARLVEVERGTWPQWDNPGQRSDAATRRLRQLGDMVARQRQARAVIDWLERPARKDVLTSVTHPLTGEPLKIVQKGSATVLAFSAALGRLVSEEDGESGGRSIEWRLPVR